RRAATVAPAAVATIATMTTLAATVATVPTAVASVPAAVRRAATVSVVGLRERGRERQHRDGQDRENPLHLVLLSCRVVRGFVVGTELRVRERDLDGSVVVAVVDGVRFLSGCGPLVAGDDHLQAVHGLVLLRREQLVHLLVERPLQVHVAVVGR